MKSTDYFDKLFDYHDPKAGDPERFSSIRRKAKELAKELAIVISENGGTRAEDIDQSIYHVRLAVYYATASIVVPT